MKSVLIPVPEADPLVDRFRLQGDWSRRLGVTAHVTLAGPFPLPQQLPMDRLAALARSAVGVRFTLSGVGRVGDSTCLLVANERPLADLRSELVNAVGGEQQVDGSWPFHLTISRGDSAATEANLRAALAKSLPLRCEVGRIVVAALQEDRLELTPIRFGNQNVP